MESYNCIHISNLKAFEFNEINGNLNKMKIQKKTKEATCSKVTFYLMYS